MFPFTQGTNATLMVKDQRESFCTYVFGGLM